MMPQKLCYPMEYINITQGSDGTYSHKGINAVDLAGKDSGKDDVFAQGDGTVLAITDKSVTIRYENVVGQSGTIYKYCDVRFFHETANTDVTVGMKLKKGDVFMKEGKKGNATGNHVHVSVVGTYDDGKTSNLRPERMFTVDPAYNHFIRSVSKDPVRIF